MDIRGERETSVRHIIADYENLQKEKQEYIVFLKGLFGDDWYNMCSNSKDKPVRLLFDKWLEINDRESAFMRTKVKY